MPFCGISANIISVNDYTVKGMKLAEKEICGKRRTGDLGKIETGAAV